MRERSTTLLSPLLFAPDIKRNGRIDSATRFAEHHMRPMVGEEAYVGVTGAIAARATQAEVITEHLPLFEIATLLFVLIAVALYFRALLAPIVNLVAVAIAYLVWVRLVATFGAALGVSVPSEVEPVIVALLFGVVTDYSLFFLSRMRRQLENGEPPQAAVRATTAELTPIILACGLAVAAACGALLVAELGFLRAFGPGMALAVLIGMAVAMTFVPACLALLGRGLFWPHRPPLRAADPEAAEGVMARVIRWTVRKPRTAIVLWLLALGALAAPIATIDLGNPLISGLPEDSEPRRAYTQASEGFVPGVLSPTVLLVEDTGVTQNGAALTRLQRHDGRSAGRRRGAGPAVQPHRARTRRAPRPQRRRGSLRHRLQGRSAGQHRDQPPRRAAQPGRRAARASRAAGGERELRRRHGAVAGDDREHRGRSVAGGPAVLLAVLLVLVVFLRGLVAPLYLIAAAPLAPLAAIGLAVGLFELLLEGEELVYYVPMTAGVLLVALGSDYNILLVGRVWDEAQRHPLKEATMLAGAGAARAISVAGIVLAFSFGAMALVRCEPSSSWRSSWPAGC